MNEFTTDEVATRSALLLRRTRRPGSAAFVVVVSEKFLSAQEWVERTASKLTTVVVEEGGDEGTPNNAGEILEIRPTPPVP